MSVKKRIIELAIVLAVLGAVAGFYGARLHKVKQRSACIGNLKMIDNLETCCVPLERKLAVGDKMDPKWISEYLKGGTNPVCPAGGEYVISYVVGGPYPTCTVHGNVLQEVLGNREVHAAPSKERSGKSQ